MSIYRVAKCVFGLSTHRWPHWQPSARPSNARCVARAHRHVDATPGGVQDADVRARDQLLGVATNAGRVVGVVVEGEKPVGWAAGLYEAGAGEDSLRFAQVELPVNKTMMFGTACFATNVSAQSCIPPLYWPAHTMSLLTKKLQQGSPLVLF